MHQEGAKTVKLRVALLLLNYIFKYGTSATTVKKRKEKGKTVLQRINKTYNNFSVVPGHPLREVVCYTHAIAAASGATGSDSPYSIVTTR